MSEKTIKLTLGEAIVRFLDAQYTQFDDKVVKFVDSFYTLFGHGCVLGVGEALALAEHGLKVMQGKNEQGMAQVAIAYAKQHNRRKIIPCISSIGPGAANMVTAAATATVNNIPLLLFMGDSYACRIPDPVLQQVEQPYELSVTTNDAFKPVTRYFDRITRPEMIISALINAMRVLTDPAHTGAVAIALPQDVQGEAYDYPLSFFEKRVHRIPRGVPEQYQIESAAELIAAAKKPLIIIGGGARYSEAQDILTKIMREFNMPAAETQAGKSVIKGTNPLNMGGLGVTGNSAANTIAAAADLIIAVGSRLTDFTTASKTLYADKKLITINASAFHAGKMNSDCPVVGDAKTALLAIYSLLKRRGYRTAYKDEPANAATDWAKEYARLAAAEYGEGYVPENTNMSPDAVAAFVQANGTALTQTAALDIIRASIPRDAIVVGSSGSLPGCLQRMWVTDKEFSYNMEYGYSCMGYEIAGAFGSKLAAPDQEVYAMAGDGSYLMLHSEMVTAVQEGIKINILLFDNSGFGCINNLQMGQGLPSLCTEFRFREGNKPIADGKFMVIDYAKNAEAYGFKTYTAKNAQELKRALRLARLQDGPTLIDIKVLPKSMTHGYEGGYWLVGNTELPRNQKQRAAYEERIAMSKKTKR